MIEVFLGFDKEKWLECMGGVAPKAIFTDQCRSIECGIHNVIPNTEHGFFFLAH
jgi:hypothetical protein